MSGETTDSEAISRFNLDDTEQVDFSQAKSKVVDSITAIKTNLTDIGLDEGVANSIAKAVVRNEITQTLMKAELEYDSRESFNSSMGIS